MKIEWHPEARKDLESFENGLQEELVKRVDNLKSNPLGEQTALFNKEGLELFRLKLKNKYLDHRVFFDLSDQKILIIGIEHRDNAYTPESISKIKSRI